VVAGLLGLCRGARAERRYRVAWAGLLALACLPAAALLVPARMRPPVRRPAPPAAAGAAAAPAAAAAALPGTDLRPALRALGRVAPWLGGAWLVGAALLLLRLGAGARRVARLARRGTPPSDALARVLAETPCLEDATVRECALIDSPMVVGWRRPRVFVPSGLAEELPLEQLRALLAHELAHVERRDPWTNLLQTVLDALLFFHPTAWWLSRRIRRERELCCDDRAVASAGDPLPYARGLLALAELRHRGGPLLIAAHGAGLDGRIRRLFGQGPPPPRLARRAAGTAALLVVLAASGAAARMTWRCQARHDALRTVSGITWLTIRNGRMLGVPRSAPVRVPDQAGRPRPAPRVLMFCVPGQTVAVDGVAVSGDRAVQVGEHVTVRDDGDGRLLWEFSVEPGAEPGTVELVTFREGEPTPPPRGLETLQLAAPVGDPSRLLAPLAPGGVRAPVAPSPPPSGR
jgi:beta-lactamase regulating signal transducer with metallopeptidase domain